MGDIGALVLKLKADASDLEKHLQKAGKSADDFGKFMGHVGKAAAVGLAAVVTAAGAVATGLFAITKSSASMGDEINKASQKLGIGTEDLSALRYAADLSDLSLQDLTTGLGKLSRLQHDASTGSKEALRSFQALGVNFRFVDGSLRPMNDLILEVADKFMNMTDETQRAALAQELFGRGGLQLIPLLIQGSAAIREQMQEARRLHLTWSTEAAQSAEDFMDGLEKLGGALRGVADDIAKVLLPHMNEAIKRMMAWILANREWIASNIIGAVESLVNWVSQLLPIFSSLGTVAKATFDVFSIGFNVISIKATALVEKFTVIKDLFASGGMFSKEAWTEAIQQFDDINLRAENSVKLIMLAALGAEKVAKNQEAIIPIIEAQNVEIQEQKQLYDDVGQAFARTGIESRLKLAQANLNILVGLEKAGQAEIDEVRAQAFRVNELQYQKDVQALQDSLQQKKISQNDYELQIRALSQETFAKNMATVQQMPGFWQTQLNAITQSNAFSMATIVNQGTNAFAQWAVQGTKFTQFWQGLQIMLVQAVAQMGIQKLATLASQAATEMALVTTTEATKVATTTTANAAIVAGNAATATTSVSIWGGATAAILGFFATIGAGFAAVTGALITAVVAVGTFIMGVLSAIAAALSATVFGIPFAGAIVVGIGLIAAALAATDNLPEFAHGGIVTGPTVGLMGEAGSAEAAIPLNDRGAKFMQSAMGMGSGMQTINLYVDGRKIAETVVRNIPDTVHRKLGYT